jgi:hypothetical protein
MRSERLDDFEDLSGWLPVASGLAVLEITPERRGDETNAMRLSFDFKGGGGFVVARKAFARPMPEAFALSFRLRGAAPKNRLELKLSDPSGRNVWWRHWDAFDFTAEPRTIRVRSSEIEFAWGPAGGGAIAELGAIELVIAAGPGGAGTVSIGDLVLEDRTYRRTPRVTASSARPGHPPELALDGDPGTSWLAEPSAGPQRFEVDFLEEREYGGLVCRWAPGAEPHHVRVEVSRDGSAWETVHDAETAGVARSDVFLPGAASRFLRLILEPGRSGSCGIADLAVQPFEFSRSIESFFEQIAASEPRGHHPRWLAHEQSYWTPIGLPDGESCAIMNEEGMVEIDRGGFSIEPSLSIAGKLVTWADVETSVSLEDSWQPVPSSRWRGAGMVLQTTAFAGRCGGVPTLYVRYRLENEEKDAAAVRLNVAIRPFQVNPPWQKFGALGGVRQIGEIAWQDGAARIDGGHWVVPLGSEPTFGAAAFAQGEITTHLAAGALPDRRAVTDAFGYASAALCFDVSVGAEGAADVYVAVPFGEVDAAVAVRLVGTDGAAAFREAVGTWGDLLGAVSLRLPPAAHEYGLTARTATAQVLVNRDGPALQPGPRRYTRSWVRDGAVMATALLHLGRNREACEFVRWYATHQRDDGNVPCCVDRSGPDWLPEHDSHGELIFTVMECFRFTGDRAFLKELWPAVKKAVTYLEVLRSQRLGPEYEKPELRARYGLLPESVSHEGYLAHPVHAYWDDFWALQGYRDAAAMAEILGETLEARRIAEIGDAFRAAIRTSLELTIRERDIPYVPGSVEWADFDPTATSNAVGLLGLADDLPRKQLDYTFDEYLTGFRRRHRGEMDWNNYSAYEIRIAGALVCLGRREDACELLDFFLRDRRPRAWNQWPEISWRDPRSPGHIGDVPHTWIGAEYVLAFRTMLAYERAADRSLVLAAGIPARWLEGGAEVAVAELPTHYGLLGFSLRQTGPDAMELSISGDLAVPPGGIVLRPPLPGGLREVRVNGEPLATFDREGPVIRQCPAEVELRFESVLAS